MISYMFDAVFVMFSSFQLLGPPLWRSVFQKSIRHGCCSCCSAGAAGCYCCWRWWSWRWWWWVAEHRAVLAQGLRGSRRDPFSLCQQCCVCQDEVKPCFVVCPLCFAFDMCSSCDQSEDIDFVCVVSCKSSMLRWHHVLWYAHCVLLWNEMGLWSCRRVGFCAPNQPICTSSLSSLVPAVRWLPAFSLHLQALLCLRTSTLHWFCLQPLPSVWEAQKGWQFYLFAFLRRVHAHELRTSEL